MTTPTLSPSAAATIAESVRRWKLTANYRGYPAIVHINTVDDGTVEINAPADAIWQKRIRVSVDELTDKQIVTA